MELSAVIDYAALLAALIAVVSAAYIAWNKAIIENYKATVESQEKLLRAQAVEITALKERVDKLEGQKEGYEFAVEAFAKAVANSGICDIAWQCRQRVLPRVTVPESRHVAIKVNGGKDALPSSAPTNVD